jgi:hypothetical protein
MAKTKAQTKPRARKAAIATTPPAKTPSGKLGTVVELLRRPEGATVEAMSAATGWQVHSVRGAMSGALKKKHGFTIVSEKTDGGRTYRISTATSAGPGA